MFSIQQNLVGSIEPSSKIIVQLGQDFGLNGPVSALHEIEFGKGAALDLIKGHLPTETNIPVWRGLGNEPVNWFRPAIGYNPDKDTHYVAKIQPFEAGGYEVVISVQDLKELAAMTDAERKKGVRVEGDQQENDIQSSINRTKKQVRYRIKSMGCDRLLTLTRREDDGISFWSVDDWATAWTKFNRLLLKAGITLQYVAVLERHKKGNFHLHAAIVGRANVKILRKIWFICLGGDGTEKGCKTPGNIDMQFRTGVTAHKRRAGLAKYVSKYITKQAGSVEFNKKRYWSSKHKLPAAIRHILNAGNATDALVEFAAMMGLDFMALGSVCFVFPEEKGFWFSFDDFMLSPPPF